MRTRLTSPTRKLSQAAGAFVHAHAPWDWWCGFTYAPNLVSQNRALGDLRKWTNVIARRAQAHVTVAFGIETQRRGVVHFHALLSFEGAPALDCSVGRACWSHGDVIVEPYDGDEGGAWYLIKEGSWGTASGCPRHARCRRRSGCVFARKCPPVPVCIS